MTIYDELLAAGLPVISADESGAIEMGVMTSDQDKQFKDIIISHFQPAEYQLVLASRADIQSIKNAYNNMITRLEQIQAATNPTNAQVIAAIQDEALYIERILKVLARLV